MNINEKTWKYIREHADDDVRKVALLGTKDPDVNLKAALQQIAGWQTARRKLPTWAKVERIVYPPHLNMEQCSSEQTALYKAELLADDGCPPLGDGIEFVDLTGGFGVDFYWIAKAVSRQPSPAARHLVYIEQNEALCDIAQHNFSQLGLSCTVCCCDTTSYLATMPHASLVFLDPARRNEHGGRTYGIADCSPNILELLPTLMKKTDRVLLKLSPMLDWRKAVADLTQQSVRVCAVHIVSVDNECKELVVQMRNDAAGALRVVCVNLLSNGERQIFETFQRQSPCVVHTIDSYLSSLPSHLSSLPSPSCFLYEPNASIMKAGCFAELEQRFSVSQIAHNSHLFLSADDIGSFPGRKFEICAISSMNKKDINRKLTSVKSANIAVRNFPMSADQLRNKLKLKDGGNTYIFATTLSDGEHKLFICRKIG